MIQGTLLHQGALEDLGLLAFVRGNVISITGWGFEREAPKTMAAGWLRESWAWREGAFHDLAVRRRSAWSAYWRESYHLWSCRLLAAKSASTLGSE